MADFWNNPWSRGLGGASNALIGLGSGLLAGKDFASGLAIGGQNFADGARVDAANLKEQKADAQTVATRNATMEWLKSKAPSNPQIADLLSAVDSKAIAPADAYGVAMKILGPKDPIKVSAGDTLLDPNTRQPIYQAADPKAAATATQNSFDNQKDLYSQYAAADPVKAYEVVKGGYERVRQSSSLKTGAGDMGLIYGYMKMLDPGSVVRESEFAMAAQAGSYGEQIQGLVSRLVNGERLPDSVRSQFVQAADKIYQDTASNLGDINKQFSTRAQGFGVDPSMFVRQPETYQPTTAIVTMPNGNTIRQLP